MALMNDYDCDYVFSMDYRDILPPMASDNTTNMWNLEEHNFTSGANGYGVKYEADNFSFPERFGVSTTRDVAEQVMPEFNINAGICSISGFQNFRPEVYDSGVELCNQFVSDFQPGYSSGDRLAAQSQCNSSASAEEPGVKVRRYSEEERKDRIIRYLNKRHRRNFNKTIKYACRKTLADRRIRVRGRFARNNDQGQESQETRDKKLHQDEEEYYDEDAELQMKHSGEEWLQEAVASLMYLPIFSGQ